MRVLLKSLSLAEGTLESCEGALLEYATMYWSLHAASLDEVSIIGDQVSDWGEELLSTISSESVIGLEAAVLRYHCTIPGKG